MHWFVLVILASPLWLPVVALVLMGFAIMLAWLAAQIAEASTWCANTAVTVWRLILRIPR